ncbi:cation diffusion facilitator family transporter [Aureispira anguillae]|uniref:Cation diffusion facilitator family transporter n=1 Tax=Aureispira anguillae TaxID=2864201 RepID=A0A915VK01_9BACT|nr:cation diffusion facilitator family transporter [Aureispira anguillae]BDS09423.1 cation diffusion facilitator family transporter [Aureispira anguillae]
MNDRLIATQRVTLIVGIILLGIKFIAYFLTHSNTILTDALESIVNVVAGAFGLFSLYVAALPKDENHPYGHGKIEFVSAAVEGVLILIAGLLIVIKSLYNLQYPVPVHDVDTGIWITAVAGLINYLLGVYVEKQGKLAASMVLVASGEHLKSDGYSTLGMIIGLGVILITNWLWLDSIVAIVFGFIIIRAGISVIKSSMAGIMDEVDYPLVKEIVVILNQNRHPECIDVHNLRVIKYGTALHVDCHITIPWYFDTRQAHDEVDRLEDLLAANTEKPIEFFVHVDPCIPESCTICNKQDCAVRQFEQQQTVEWTVENIMLNQKHFMETQQ